MAPAYRIVSEPAVVMIAGAFPVALLAKKLKALYKHKGEEPREAVGFQSYLHKIGKARSLDCVFCNGVVNDANRTFFSCGRWDWIRQQLYLNTGDLSPDNIVKEMLRSADRWSRVARYVRIPLVAKKIELDR